MKLKMRSDLDGYGPKLPSLQAVDGVEITKPVVLFYGPNGSGKTSLLKMLRAVNGLAAEKTGFHPAKYQELRMRNLADAGGDLGMLAAYTKFGGTPELRDDLPGVLDVKELGWTGQRMFSLSGRTLTASASAAHFDDGDFSAHVGLIMRNKESSHGQLLLPEWNNVLMWAAGVLDIADPFDEKRPEDKDIRVNDVWKGSYIAHHDLYEACSGHRAGEPGRVSERWLLLDEPELAIDMPSLAAILSALLVEADPGHLRVFCASHSPLFAAGLANHPKVQVIDLSQGWLQMTTEILALVAHASLVDNRGNAVMRGLKQDAVAAAAAKSKRASGEAPGKSSRKPAKTAKTKS